MQFSPMRKMRNFQWSEISRSWPGGEFHDAPNVMHFGQSGEGDVLQSGMFFTVEPVIMLVVSGLKHSMVGFVTKDRFRRPNLNIQLPDGRCHEVLLCLRQGLDKPPYNI